MVVVEVAADTLAADLKEDSPQGVEKEYRSLLFLPLFYFLIDFFPAVIS